MRDLLAALSICALAACSSGSSGAAPQTGPAPIQETVRVTGGAAGPISISSVSDVNEVAATVAAAPEKVFGVLHDVYDAIGIPVTTFDANKRVIGNSGAQLRHRLGKTMLSRYIDCGQTQTAPNADTYEVYLSIVTRVTATDAGGSAIGTTLEALARPMTNSGNYSRCSSTRRLEDQIVTMTRARVQQ